MTGKPRDRRFQPQGGHAVKCERQPGPCGGGPCGGKSQDSCHRQPATAFGTWKEETYGPSISTEYRGPAHSNSDRGNNDRDDMSCGLADGDSYVLQYSEHEDMSGAKTLVVNGAENTSRVIGGLRKGKTYYVSIRVRKKVDGINYYTTFGVPKKVKIEK